MKHFSSLIFATLLTFYSQAQQHTFQVWEEIGFQGKFTKKTEYAVDWTNRLGYQTLQTTFVQASVKYKLTKWLRPSVDYRWISNRDDNGNFLSNHRLNLNVQLTHDIKRFNLGLRLRYQYSFKQLFSSSYDPEFDLSYRIKPALSYNIKNSFLTPKISVEYFYNPNNSELGNRFTKVRYYAGFEMNLKGPHTLEAGYILDQRINLPDPLTKHILSLNYTYSIEKKKSEKKTEKEKN